MRRPALDTGPLSKNQLTTAEVDLLFAINELVDGMREDQLTPPRRSMGVLADSPWARLNTDRRHRVILIDGDRGTGKTSLMLTLISFWRPGNLSSLEDPEGTHGIVGKIVESGRSLRVLQPIDFDPMPEGMSVFGWIVQAFGDIVRFVSMRSPAINDPLNPFDRLVENDDDAASSFRALERSVARGWHSEIPSGEDEEDFILRSRNQQRAWHDIRAHFRDFVDALIRELEYHGQPVFPPSGGVIILPIDDIDLQVERARDLVNALRYLEHPRIVYLLNGYYPDLESRLSLGIHQAFIPDYSRLSSAA